MFVCIECEIIDKNINFKPKAKNKYISLFFSVGIKSQLYVSLYCHLMEICNPFGL